MSGEADTSPSTGSVPYAGLGADPTRPGVDEASHPELLAGAAFAGGLLAAMILKRLGGGE